MHMPKYLGESGPQHDNLGKPLWPSVLKTHSMVFYSTEDNSSIHWLRIYTHTPV